MKDKLEKLWLDPSLTLQAIADKLGISETSVRRLAHKLKLPSRGRVILSPAEQLSADRIKRHHAEEIQKGKVREGLLLKEIEQLTKQVEIVKKIKDVSIHTISPWFASGSEATAIAVASDWHIEETVELGQVSGLNEFNLEISKHRTEEFFRIVVRMVSIFRKDIPIKTLVLALLGDFISGSIHEELAEGNALLPIDALLRAQDTIASGIKYILDHTDLELVIPCHSGNHGRATVKQRHATENGNSYEYYMYHNLARHFAGSKRITFLISAGYHSYVKVYDYTIRFHHGHDIKYGGGIGGLFIPAFKAVSQWNKGHRADLDVFGHFHQRKDGGNFLTNGSIIGYNAYALSIKADFEKASQLFFLIDKMRGRTLTAPILFTR